MTDEQPHDLMTRQNGSVGLLAGKCLRRSEQ